IISGWESNKPWISKEKIDKGRHKSLVSQTILQTFIAQDHIGVNRLWLRDNPWRVQYRSIMKRKSVYVKLAETPKIEDIRGVKSDKEVVDLIDVDIEDGNIKSSVSWVYGQMSSRRLYRSKDDFRNKRLELAAELLERELKVHLRQAQKRMVKAIRNEEEVLVLEELIHRIQSLLPVKEATRSCKLSKWWLRAWSTIPTVRLSSPDNKYLTDEQETYYKNLIHRTLQSQNLDTISVTAGTNDLVYPLRLSISSSTHIIRCVSLRVLDLQCVDISEDVLNNLLSTCTLLEKINLWCCEGLKKNVKLTNLVRLRDLEISSLEEDDLWDITNVPTLASFYYRSLFGSWTKPIPFQMESLAAASVTQLRLDGLALDNSFFDIVKAKFPLLQSLTLGIGHWGLPQLVITNDSLKWLTRDVYEPGPLNVQVYAPALLSFTYIGLHMIPGLSFPSIAPEHINLTFTRREPMEHSFFLKMREALNLSSKFDINIIHYSDNEQQEDLLVPVGIL
ncbi:F-box protein-like protein, partial [Tanacetum coccineum]